MSDATCIMLFCNGRLLLLRRSNSLSRFPGKLCFPGGKVEQLESSMDAVRRELVEETGVVLDEKDIKFYDQIKLKDGLIIDYYISRINYFPNIILSSEHTEYSYYTKESVWDCLSINDVSFVEFLNNSVIPWQEKE